MMTTYTRRGPGQSYLKSCLAEKIYSLIEHKDLNLEINPLKVGNGERKHVATVVASVDLNLNVFHALGIRTNDQPD